MFVEDFRPGIPTYEIRKKKCLKTGAVKYRKFKIASYVHDLCRNLNHKQKGEKE